MLCKLGLLCLSICGLANPTLGFTLNRPLSTFSSSSKINNIDLRQSALSATSSTKDYLEPGDRVLLLGPGFLQLVIAKALKAAGLVPMIVAPQKKLESFSRFVGDDEIMAEADIGLPDELGKVSGVVFCSEEAVYGESIVKTIMDWDGYKDGVCTRAICCVPILTSKSKEKAAGWMPIFNNDAKGTNIWNAFTKAFKNHPVSGSASGAVIHFGNLFGGSVDGPPCLLPLGLDESIYKMTLENYRDLKERSFDRFRLGAQIIEGDAINPKPTNLEKLEKEAIKKDELIEAYRIVGGYPEVDGVNRHVVAQAVTQALMRPSRGDFTVSDESSSVISVPKEFTVLSKCLSEFPTNEEWDELFQNPGPAKWPDPYLFDPSTLPKVTAEEPK